MADAVDSRLKRKLGWRQVLRFLLALVALLFCYRLIADSARAGASGLLTITSFIQSAVGPADLAVRLAPGDPEAHYTRALELVNAERIGEAVDELRQATRLRPHHYYQWLDLGVTLNRVGDQAGAVAAVRESVRLAPRFAQPRWQLGNLLFQQERYQEAFAELQLAARSNPNLFEQLLELAWLASNGDVTKFLAFSQPETKSNLFSTGRFLAVKERWSESAKEAAAAGDPEDEVERALLHQTITRLLAARQFSEAFLAWSASHRSGHAGEGGFLNGEFNDSIVQDDPGFGWQLQSQPNVSAAIDSLGPASGGRSLVLIFSGDSSPQVPLLQQLILLPHDSLYSLSFMSKTQDLVTGGPPLIAVFDMSGTSSKILAQSSPLPSGTSQWSASELQFSTGPQTSAVLITVQRSPCPQNPCPIFGRLWLGAFHLTKK
jgi:tetratricopeptide (TPR) repeat protein